MNPFNACTSSVHQLSIRLGTSTRLLRTLILVGGLLGLLISALWLGALLDTTWIPDGKADSARVVQALIGLLALLCLSMPAGMAAWARNLNRP